MRLYQEQERLCREVGTLERLAICLENQGVVLAAMNRQREALPLVEEAYRLAADHELLALAQKIKPLLDAVRAKAG